MQVELSQLEGMTWSDFDVTITIPIIIGATGTINICQDQIYNHLWKLILVQVNMIDNTLRGGTSPYAVMETYKPTHFKGTTNIYSEVVSVNYAC